MSDIENSYPPGSTFDLLYEKIVALYYYTDSLPSNKEFIGNASPRVCALCPEESACQNSFSMESHLIPAALGNRKYFSLEECDVCNKKYADKHDDHLAKMLLPERIIGRVPMRKGYPESKSKDGESKIGYDHQMGALKFEIDTSSQNPIIKHLSKKEFEINFDVQKFRPHSAILSILRSVWLAMTPMQRSYNKQIKKLIREELKLSLTEFSLLHIAGEFKAVLLEAWQKRENQSHESSALLVRLCIGNAAIIWWLPTNGTKGGETNPLPTFPENIKFSLEKVSIANDTIISGKRSLLFTHGGAENVTEQSDPMKSSAETTLRRKFPQESVILEFLTEDTTWKLDDVILEERQNNSAVVRYKLMDLDSTWSMTLHHEIQKQSTKAEVHSSDNKQTLDEYRKTQQFLTAIRTASGRLRCYSKDGDVRIEYTFMYSSDKQAEAQREKIVEEAKMRDNFAKSLITINRKFGLMLNIPNYITRENYTTAMNISYLIEHEFIEKEAFRASANIIKQDALDICTSIMMGTQDQIIFEDDYRPNLLDVEIDAGRLRVEFLGVRLAQADLLITEFSSAPDGTEVLLNFQCTKMITRLV